MVIISIGLGLLVAGLCGFLLGKSRSEATIAVLRTRLEHATDGSRSSDEELLLSRFDQLSRNSLSQAREQLGTDLAKLEHYLQMVERERKSDYGDLFRQMQNVAEVANRVQSEAAELKSVLRTSTSGRGRWGEVQLRRVVELAGMLEHADFAEQKTARDEEGISRADLVVYLPGNVAIAVDAKVPYTSYERAQGCTDPESQRQLFVDHARQFRAHVDALAKRCYWERYLPSSGFCVLFVPGEALLDAALMHDVGLWERAAEKQILLATPSTLIALLRMAALGWRQQAQADNAAEIVQVGKELHKRVTKAAGDIDKLGRGLRSSVNAYNEFIGAFEGRVLPQARRLGDLTSGEGSIATMTPVDESPRRLQAADSPLAEVNIASESA